MDEASKLVSELQLKLAELDNKVLKYRQEMATEFDKYAESLLRDVPKDISETVSKKIAEDIKGYNSLYPTASVPSIESCAGTSTVVNGDRSPQLRASPISTPSLRPVEDKETLQRSPHERDKEFQGVFTPTYLPLLDSTSRNERRSSTEHTTSPPPSDYTYREKDMNYANSTNVDASTDTRSLMNSPESTRPPTPRRRNTDELSIGSDRSDGPVRRSALRRTSSLSRHSPRRVRFEVAGEEVLPTSSPVPVKSPIAEDTEETARSLLDSDDELGSEQIEDVGEEPPPKRISSSQALKLLSRSPLEEDGTQWTTVTAPPDGSASVATTNGFSLGSDDEEDIEPGEGISQLSLGGALNTSAESTNITSQTLTLQEEIDEEAGTYSDDEMLDMPPLRRQPSSPASMLSPVISPNIENNKSPTSATRPSRFLQNLTDTGTSGMRDEDLNFNDEDEDEMFHFDENAKPKQTKPLLPEQDEEYDQFDTDAQTSPLKEATLSKFSSSPARAIVRPIPPSTAPLPSTGVVGSYKGRPFTMPIVSPDVHAQAASMGDMQSFVGSMKDQDGLEGSFVQSFRASGGVASFSGTPRSLSERMMLDDMMEEQVRRRK